MYQAIVKKLDDATVSLEKRIPFHTMIYVESRWYLLFNFNSYKSILAFYLDLQHSSSYKLLGIFEEGMDIEPFDLYDLIVQLNAEPSLLPELIKPYHGREVIITV